MTPDETEQAILTWRNLLDRRIEANFGITVKTDRGDERLYTIQATERDLADLAKILEQVKS